LVSPTRVVMVYSGFVTETRRHEARMVAARVVTALDALPYDEVRLYKITKGFIKLDSRIQRFAVNMLRNSPQDKNRINWYQGLAPLIQDIQSKHG
jgi:hypothetical protein